MKTTNNTIINSIMKTTNTIFKNFATRLFLLVTALTMTGTGQLWADSWTWTAASGEQEWFEGRTNGRSVLNGKIWSFTRTNVNTTAFSSSSIQFGKQYYTDDVVLYSDAIGGTITQIDVVSSSYGANHTIKIEVGGSIVLTEQATANGTTPGNKSTGTISKTGPIKISFKAANASARYLYVKSITVTYTTGTFNVDWFVGETKIKAETGVTSGTPPAVSDDALGGDCSSLKFLGWSKSDLGNTPTSAPIDLFSSNEVPPLSGNTTYYAVFGEVATNTDDSVLIQFLKYDTWTYSGTTSNQSSYRLFAASAYVQSDAFDLSRLAKVAVGAGYYSSSSYGGFSIKDASGNSWNSGSATTNDEKQYIFRSGSSLTGYKALRVIASSGNGSSNGLRLYKIRIYQFPLVYSNCRTICSVCTQLDAPGNLAESNLTPTSVQLSWDDVSNASSYTVTIEGSSYEKVINNINTTSVTVDDLSEGCSAEYLWTVKAIGDGEDYCDSEESTTGDFTTPTLSSIALSGTYPTDFAVGDAFSHGSQVVTATYSNGATKVVTGSCSWTGYNMSSGGDQTVTVSYTECTTPRTATYGIHLATYGNYVFTCAELTLEAHPETAGAPIFITSVAGKKVRSQGYIQITGSGLTPNQTLTFPGLPDQFEIKTAAYGDLATDASGAIDAAAYIFYTPAAGATSDGLDKITGITVTVGGAKTKTVSLTQDIIGRHLPADFVIAAKKDGKWYALPADMTTTTHPAPSEIAVDNATTPTVAYTAETNIYNLYGQNSGAGYLEEAGQYVKLGMKNNPTYANYPLLGTTSTAIGKSTGTDPTHNLDKQYWWLFIQTNTSITNPQDAKYTIYCANNTTNHLRLKDNAGSPEWGLYDSGIEELRLIPAGSVVFAEAEIVEWGRHGAIIEVDATAINATKVKALLNGSESSIVTVSTTGTSVKGTATKYNYTASFGDGIDFAAATSNGATLTLEWYNSSDVMVGVSNIIVPKIIAASATMTSIESGDTPWSKWEVHVLPGVTLEANAGSFESSDVTIKHLEIYQGATVNITTGTLTATTLVLRNGWRRIGAKSYDMSRLYITPSDGSLKATNVFADWYIDFDQYYPIAVPWNATIASMSYKNTSSAVSVGPSSSNSVRLRYYDGDSRAKGEGSAAEGDNWKQYGEAGGTAVPSALVPGKAYAMTARRPSGKAFSIIRMPLTLPSGTWGAGSWTTGGELGNISDTHKDQVTVTAYAYEKTPEYAKGWNFIANPYMANYQGTIEYADETKINVVNIPDVDFKEYGQYATATTKLAPASGFLIQAPKDGTLTFGTANRKNAAPSILRTKQADAVPEQQAYILLKDESAEDMMGIFVSEKYTAEYDLNGDVEKLLSNGTSLRTYMHYGDMNMAYVAVNETLAKEWIPVTIRVPETGEYTFSIHEASIAGELEGVYLIDYENGDQVTNLLEENYPFYAENGTISGRFAINAIVGNRVPTDIDAVGAGSDSTKPMKFIYRDQMYILLNGAIYDATGKKVREINK